VVYFHHMVRIPTRENPEPPPSPFEQKNVPAKNDVEENKAIAALSYFWIVSVVVLFAKKDSPFAQFHAKQGLVLFLSSFVLWFVGSFVPFIGWVNLIVLLCAVRGIISALQGKRQRIPGVADIVEKLNL
jgi:uncharacterized membrane protein